MNIHTPDPTPEPDSNRDQDTGPEALLSAYLDGELTSEEIALVESHLESSEESRRRLDELRTLSEYLVAIQPESAPEALRGTLDTLQPTSPPATGTYRGRWIAAAVAVVALVMVATIPRMTAWSPVPTGTEGENVAVLQDSTSQQTKTWFSESIQPSAVSAESDDAGGPELVFNKAPDKAEVGQILSAIDTSDGQAVVVRLTVVDVKQGLDSLRLLLQKHQIAAADTLAADRDGVRDKQVAGLESAKGGQLVSVVVRASSNQVSEAMANLRREVASEMELAGVLQVAALETAPGGRHALNQLQTYDGTTRRQFGSARKLREQPAAGRAARKVRPEAAPGANLGTQPALASAQVRLDLPPDLMRRVNKARSESKSSVASKESGERQVQVVFVLVGEPQPASPAGSDPDGAA
ncbi:MAG: zf-HC2 domain-containing protein [Planctomycetota bacterium]|nr:zf-HC2 domain-containing protein [Planctomycetota bacterium]